MVRDAGDGLVMLAQHLKDRGCPAEIVYLDLSKASRAIAEEHGFHELVHKSELTETRPRREQEARELDDSTREVVANLETLEYELVL